uniref:Uncharacterized protein n=1 Tax=Romanomermis culicivorax TaxID=13658 RepID=A0A915KNQ5_ROMCU
MVSTNPFDQSIPTQRHHQSTADHSQAKVESSPMKKDAQHTSWPLANRQSSASEELPGISSKPEPKPSKHDHAAPSSSAIPGLGGVELFGGHGNGHSNLPLTLPAGARKTLLKQPPPKKAQRQFERVWNVSNDRFSSEYDEGSSAADNEYRYKNRSEDNRMSPEEIYRHHHDEQQQAPVQKRRQDDTMAGVNPYAQGQPPIKKFYPAIPSLMNAAAPPGIGADGGQVPQVMDLLPVPYDLGPGGWEEAIQNSGQPGWDLSGQIMPQQSLDIRPPFGDIDFRRQPKPPFGDNFAARFPPMPPPGSGLPMPLMMAPVSVPPINAPKDPRQMKIAINLSTTSLQQQQQQSNQQQISESIIIGPQLPISDPRLTRDPRSRATSQAEQMASYMSGSSYAALLDAQSSMMANMMSGGGGDMDLSRGNAAGGSPLVNPKRKWKRDYEAEEEEKRYEPDIYGNNSGGNESPPPNNYGTGEKRNSGGGSGSDVDERHRKRYW